MGLGKTLAMLSLILKHKQLVDSGELPDDVELVLNKQEEERDRDREWLSKDKKSKAFYSFILLNMNHCNY